MTGDGGSSEPEFGSMASWTVEAVDALGDEHAVAAGCRGSGGPGALEWFTRNLGLRRGDRLLDVGAGMGGPAAWASRTCGAVPVLVEPMLAACRAADALFELPAVAATAEHLPLPDASFARIWSLGVLCTTSDQPAALRELARVLAPGGRGGLLVYRREVARLDVEPAVNHFPSADELSRAVQGAGLRVAAASTLAEQPDPPPDWRETEAAVDEHVERAHGASEVWREARDDEDAVAHLLRSGQIAGHLLVLAHR